MSSVLGTLKNAFSNKMRVQQKNACLKYYLPITTVFSGHP